MCSIPKPWNTLEQLCVLCVFYHKTMKNIRKAMCFLCFCVFDRLPAWALISQGQGCRHIAVDPKHQKHIKHIIFLMFFMVLEQKTYKTHSLSNAFHVSKIKTYKTHSFSNVFHAFKSIVQTWQVQAIVSRWMAKCEVTQCVPFLKKTSLTYSVHKYI